jgi:predicted outer membrane repeat protein
MRALLAFILLAALLPAPAQAKRIFVPQQHRRLQAAINAAADGDTIWVGPGIYYGPFVLKKRLVLFGEGGPGKTILDGRDTTRVLHVEGVTRASILGFRIQNGKAAGGSGIYCLRDTALAIESCEVRGNWEAGVAAWKCGMIQFADAEISGNHGSGLTASDSRIQLLRVTFRDNHAPTGGAVSLVNSELYIAKDCVFESNRADDGTGGGIFGEGSSVRLLSCFFHENSAASSGGAIAVMDSSDLRIRTTRFAGNRSASGGAVLTDRSYLDVQLSVFDKNRATAAGAAVQILGRRTPGVNPVLINNTFYRNGVDADQGQGAAVFADQVSPEITRNIFAVDSTAKNKSVLEMRGAARYECNLIYAMDGTSVPASANTITGNPSFCDPEKGDFRVHDLSPAMLAPCGKIGALGKGCSAFKLLPSR